jgi:transcription elongation factor GreB
MNQRTNYITVAGYQRLKKELRYLWKEERPIVTKRVSDAAKEGDRSENAEYIYSKKRLREIDRRIRFLTKRLDNLQVVKEVPSVQSKVYFGARVTLEDAAGESKSYRLVGGDEFDRAADFISIDSPVAKALIGKSVGDWVSVITPKGEIEYCVQSIDYQESIAELAEVI